MFLMLLLATLLVASGVSLVVMLAFTKPLDAILKRIIADDISSAWLKYMKFAILVVGISAGVRIYHVEKYITPARADKAAAIAELTFERWVLELYRTVIETLQGIAWMLLVFFVFALVAYVIVRLAELKLGERRKS
jgi:ABC-type xylose transport system permease subunit